MNTGDVVMVQITKGRAPIVGQVVGKTHQMVRVVVRVGSSYVPILRKEKNLILVGDGTGRLA